MTDSVNGAATRRITITIPFGAAVVTLESTDPAGIEGQLAWIQEHHAMLSKLAPTNPTPTVQTAQAPRRQVQAQPVTAEQTKADRVATAWGQPSSVHNAHADKPAPVLRGDKWQPDPFPDLVPTCTHGARVWTSGTNRSGTQYGFYSCPQPQGTQQCDLLYPKDIS